MIMYLSGYFLKDQSQFNELVMYLGVDRYRECPKLGSIAPFNYTIGSALAVDIQLSDEEMVWIKLRYPNVVVEV